MYINCQASSREILSSVVYEQQRRKPACASVQTDQRLCFLLLESIISKLATGQIQQVPVAEETGLKLALSKPLRLSGRGPIVMIQVHENRIYPLYRICYLTNFIGPVKANDLSLKLALFFLSINHNTCFAFGCSKEPSHWDSFILVPIYQSLKHFYPF